MAQRTVIQMTDDLDNEPIEEGEGETVRLALDGTEYELDLRKSNAARLRDELAPFLSAPRKVGGGDGRRRRGGGRAAPRSIARMVQRCREVQRRTWCSSRPVRPLAAWNDSSMRQCCPATRTRVDSGTGLGL
jgi:Lsr2